MLGSVPGSQDKTGLLLAVVTPAHRSDERLLRQREFESWDRSAGKVERL